ncbi:restriction endonuclease subunit S [uncultured Rikenella sp.]|uniref:restriction endonuclease subunit S n=1 Tax=uncultured Rikenella sp. TaxID=368003 RepID=UPI00261A6E83|nr:restriction endonuclease subunit S [uncultured Rikenella sp.]
MEGLEIKEKKLYEVLSNKDFRIDSSFYTKEPKKNPDLIYAKIGEHLISSQYGISIEMNTDSVGYPIYRMNEIHDMLCDLDVDKCADITQAEYDRFVLKDRDVLFNRTNSFEWVGRTGIYYQNDDIQRTFASYLVRLNPKDSILPEYLCAYLNCKYGEWDVKRRARQSINQTNVNPEEVKEIEIPILDVDLQQKIQECFMRANSLRVLSKTIYSEAELILHEELDIDLSAMVSTTVAQKRFSDFVNCGRLDAEYYQPKYDGLFSRLSKFETKRLGDIVQIRKSIEPGSEAYQNKGIPFIRVSNLSKFGFSDTEIHLSPDEYGDVIRPKQNTILLSKDGSVGIAYKVEQDMNVITSGAILHLTITDDEFMPDYLTLVLNSVIVGMQAERDAGGSIIQHWKPSEIENVIIPKLSKEIQQEITNKVKESFALRRESKRLLNLAKTAVETAIEQDESAAMELLN